MSGGRKPAIDKSPFRDEIRALLKQKGKSEDPTYAELSDQIEERYGEEFSVGQLRDYMQKQILPEEMMPAQQAQDELEKKRETIDIAARRQDLVEIQENRRQTALETEQQMSGMILEQASDMLKLEDQLLNSLSEDYERLGILESTTDVNVDVTQVQSDPFAELLSDSLREELDEEDLEDEIEHGEYAENLEDVVESEEEFDEGEDEDVFLDKDADDIDFDDLDD